jgi:hypothetical protein
MNLKYIFYLVTSLLSVTETSLLESNISLLETENISGTSELFDSNTDDSDEVDESDYIEQTHVECEQISYFKKELESPYLFWNNLNWFNNKILPANPIRLSQFFIVEPDRVLLRLFYYSQANKFKFNSRQLKSHDLSWPYTEIIDATDNIKLYIRHLNKIIY